MEVAWHLAPRTWQAGAANQEKRGYKTHYRWPRLPWFRALRGLFPYKETNQAKGCKASRQGQEPQEKTRDHRLIQGYGLPCRLQEFIFQTNK